MEHGRLKIRVRTGTAHAGYVAMQTGAICRLRRRFLIFVIGGPAANLLSLPLTALLVNHVFPAWSHSWLAIPAGQFAAISLAIGIGSLLPFGDGSDGQRIAILFRSPVATRRLLTCLALGSQVRKGIRPKLWKHTWLDTASRLRDGAKDEFFGKWLAYVSANDAKDADLAAFYLERCLELARGRGSKLLDIAIREATVFTAWFWQDANLAEKWLAQVKRPGQVSPSRQDQSRRCPAFRAARIRASFGTMGRGLGVHPKNAPLAKSDHASRGLGGVEVRHPRASATSGRLGTQLDQSCLA
jgi:hypothetical protein